MCTQEKQNKTYIKNFRLSKNDVDRLNKIAKKEKKNKSVILRELIELKYFSLFDKRTVEINKRLKFIFKKMVEYEKAKQK